VKRKRQKGRGKGIKLQLHPSDQLLMAKGFQGWIWTLLRYKQYDIISDVTTSISHLMIRPSFSITFHNYHSCVCVLSFFSLCFVRLSVTDRGNGYLSSPISRTLTQMLLLSTHNTTHTYSTISITQVPVTWCFHFSITHNYLVAKFLIFTGFLIHPDPPPYHHHRLYSHGFLFWMI
jgi:hypothetical protein